MLRQGFAKEAFAEIYQRAPWLTIENHLQERRWPFLLDLFKQKRLSYLDYVLTHRLLRNNPDVKEEAALFLCHLTLAAKEGHLCVRIHENGLNPSVSQLWRNEEGQSMAMDDELVLTQFLLAGAQMIPDEIITILHRKMDSIPLTPICREGKGFYLQRHWIFETLFLKYLKRHLKTPPVLQMDAVLVKKTLCEYVQGKILIEEQSQAIMQGCMSAVTLVTGGPGTGKTYTAGHLIKVFWSHLSNEQKEQCEIILAAPTGKAAANLQNSLSKAAASLEGFPQIQAKTLHALLGIRQHSAFQEAIRLTADLVIVDESSMIDVKMMARLFESLKPGSRLILLGDPNQLPSVEAGSIFIDLIQLRQSFPSLPIPCIPLTTCLRVELKSLINFAELVNKGEAQEVLLKLNQSTQGVKRLYLSEDKEKAQKEYINRVIPYFPTVIMPGQKQEDLLNLFQSIRLLSPIRKGPFGVEALNHLIWNKICQKIPMTGSIAIPIMVTANDYHQELFNGETGVLVRKLPLQSISLEDYALFPSRDGEGSVRRVSALMLPKYEFAYCLSVHKSQGSEFEHVKLVLPEGSELFGREVFYTAITRARREIEIYGSDAVILKTVMNKGVRLSGIEERFMSNESLNE